ncbi:hypothetical protein [Legionella fallonii]|uniref:hypothetical protein n=1 Tax=Legionella fallonii TaxID=96230 RepID=UPI0012ED24C6|nr:hypothetical protein [Legionella fallonii]
MNVNILINKMHNRLIKLFLAIFRLVYHGLANAILNPMEFYTCQQMGLNRPRSKLYCCGKLLHRYGALRVHCAQCLLALPSPQRIWKEV